VVAVVQPAGGGRAWPPLPLAVSGSHGLEWLGRGLLHFEQWRGGVLGGTPSSLLYCCCCAGAVTVVGLGGWRVLTGGSEVGFRAASYLFRQEGCGSGWGRETAATDLC
jgi:hypothetical protein